MPTLEEQFNREMRRIQAELEKTGKPVTLEEITPPRPQTITPTHIRLLQTITPEFVRSQVEEISVAKEVQGRAEDEAKKQRISKADTDISSGFRTNYAQGNPYGNAANLQHKGNPDNLNRSGRKKGSKNKQPYVKKAVERKALPKQPKQTYETPTSERFASSAKPYVKHVLPHREHIVYEEFIMEYLEKARNKGARDKIENAMKEILAQYGEDELVKRIDEAGYDFIFNAGIALFASREQDIQDGTAYTIALLTQNAVIDDDIYSSDLLIGEDHSYFYNRSGLSEFFSEAAHEREQAFEENFEDAMDKMAKYFETNYDTGENENVIIDDGLISKTSSELNTVEIGGSKFVFDEAKKQIKQLD